MDAAIFLPQDQQRHAGLLQLDGELRPVRLVTSPLALFDAGAGEKTMLQSIVCQFSWQWPAQPGGLSPIQIILHRTSGDPEHHRNLAYACPAGREPKHLSYVSHGQPSLRRHEIPLVDTEEIHAKVADPKASSGRKNRPVIDWNAVRLQIGTLSGF